MRVAPVGDSSLLSMAQCIRLNIYLMHSLHLFAQWTKLSLCAERLASSLFVGAGVSRAAALPTVCFGRLEKMSAGKAKCGFHFHMPIGVAQKSKELGQTAGFSLWFHLPTGHFGDSSFEPLAQHGTTGRLSGSGCTSEKKIWPCFRIPLARLLVLKRPTDEPLS